MYIEDSVSKTFIIILYTGAEHTLGEEREVTVRS